MTDFSEATTRRQRTNTTNTAISALAVVWDVLDYESLTNVEIIGLASICKPTREKAMRILRIRKAQSIFPEMCAEKALASYRRFT
jgi:predicted nuclease with TOPRIM domain